jgi:hypothetical protein
MAHPLKYYHYCDIHNLYFIWAHLGSNQGPTGYEPVALPTELWARLDRLTDSNIFVKGMVVLID